MTPQEKIAFCERKIKENQKIKARTDNPHLIKSCLVRIDAYKKEIMIWQKGLKKY